MEDMLRRYLVPIQLALQASLNFVLLRNNLTANIDQLRNLKETKANSKNFTQDG